MPLDPIIQNQAVVIESPNGTVLGFRKETLDAKGVTQVEFRILDPEKTFQRTKAARVDKAQLGKKFDDLPAWIGSAPPEEQLSPEDLRLLEAPDKIGRDRAKEKEIESQLERVGVIEKAEAVGR